mmetsp:Transcript_16791/g.30084  ORF Transcript_16791/g.30084 Transcript_16791/m.30084 type:complete len:122 (+) Transcript_16791:178-543(+)|eukprot:CAMPEP_0171484732 /NCGR_PEP_ID=MMETSP0958-20121227/164_1 /TAXON_ID=87120 /ORGANISM="Aurantiochytrium limacinum, Strain ATCCMYA-1381" /LENGTH=121 /DNA_ID=CAMNT_0012017465 /DNA_START=110 /DNA_END=475 /DNA_ORIENTATION=-
MKSTLAVAGISGALAIGLGAFGAHGLRSKVEPRMLQVWETAAHYHLVHSVALLVVAHMGRSSVAGKAAPSVTLPTMLFSTGIVLFSGSLYAMVLTGESKLGMITPVGGLSLMAGWLSLLFL